jgi:hypothetical protein
MQKNPYLFVLVESYLHSSGGSIHERRIRPLSGQGISTSMKTECSAAMRMKHPLGTIFRIKAKITDREGGTPFLYSHHSWKYEVVETPQKAQQGAAANP